MRHFATSTCIDWSGARGEHQPGIALAAVEQSKPPALLPPPFVQRHWSRASVLNWMRGLANMQADMLIGIDASFGFPFLDHGCFFPQWPDSPADARALWAMVEGICSTDPHLEAGRFLAHADGQRHFRHGKGNVGDLFEGGIGRLRLVEAHQRATGQANSWSCFNLVGAGQVGKSSLTVMRLLHQLDGCIPVWPFDPVPTTGPMIIEIYTTMAARAAAIPAGRSKIRDAVALRNALTVLGSKVPRHLERIDDHATDALITAAWLSKAHTNSALWQPKLLTDAIAQTEGWTFGVI